jgi:thioesterase domain-containing protein
VSVAAFLEDLRNLDVAVWCEGDQLRCNAPPGVLTPALRDQLRARKTAILAFLRLAERAAHQPRAIVPLQPGGSSSPVFAVGGHNGDVFCYRKLAHYLGDDQPFFGLQPPGLDGEAEPFTSVEGLASYFADQIRASAMRAPAVIAGYCAGGAIAFELARQLANTGYPVAFVALFAGRYPAWFRPIAQARQAVLYYVDRLRTHALALRRLSNEHRWRYAANIIGRFAAPKAPAPPVAVEDVPMIQRAKVQRATMMGVRTYRPAFYPGRLVLFLPSPRARRRSEGLLRWHGLAHRVEEYCGPEGCEGDAMLAEPYVPTIAELFRRALTVSSAPR